MQVIEGKHCCKALLIEYGPGAAVVCIIRYRPALLAGLCSGAGSLQDEDASLNVSCSMAVEWLAWLACSVVVIRIQRHRVLLT